MPLFHRNLPEIDNIRSIDTRTPASLVRKLGSRFALSDGENAALEKLLMQNVRSMQTGTVFAEAGTAQTEINVMIAGWALRYKTMPDGTRQIVAIHLPGDVCDFNALLTEVADSETTTLADARVASISRSALAQLTSRFPKVSHALWWESLVAASVQREWLVNICRRPALQRMAHLFCELEARLGIVGLSEGQIIDLPLSQKDIGNACAMTVEHSNRTLRQLREAGLLQLIGGRLHIADLEELRNFSSFDHSYLHGPSVKQASDEKAASAAAPVMSMAREI